MANHFSMYRHHLLGTVGSDASSTDTSNFRSCRIINTLNRSQTKLNDPFWNWGDLVIWHFFSFQCIKNYLISAFPSRSSNAFKKFHWKARPNHEEITINVYRFQCTLPLFHDQRVFKIRNYFVLPFFFAFNKFQSLIHFWNILEILWMQLYTSILAYGIHFRIVLVF